VSTPEVDCIGAPPHPEGLEDVRCWRHDYARGLGFDEPEAALIAHRAEIDIHARPGELRVDAPSSDR